MLARSEQRREKIPQIIDDSKYNKENVVHQKPVHKLSSEEKIVVSQNNMDIKSKIFLSLVATVFKKIKNLDYYFVESLKILILCYIEYCDGDMFDSLC